TSLLPACLLPHLSPHWLRPPPSFTLFPYTTLFRSQLRGPGRADEPPLDAGELSAPAADPPHRQLRQTGHALHPRHPGRLHERRRSEEHTSELQSLTNLVCRLLLEKKKHRTVKYPHD